MELAVIPNQPYTVVAISFGNNNDQLYNYRTRLEVKTGDSAVVEVNGTLKIVTIIEVPSTQRFRGDLKWLVDVIDTDTYLNRLKEEVEIEEQLTALEVQAKQLAKIKAVKDALPAELQAQFDALVERKKAL